MLVEVLLELLVSIVDAQLFKTVFLEGFEAKDIEDAERVDSIGISSICCVHLLSDVCVNFAHDPREELPVDCFGAGVACWDRLV